MPWSQSCEKEHEALRSVGLLERSYSVGERERKVDNKEATGGKDEAGEMVAGHYAKQKEYATTIIEEWTNAKKRKCTWEEEALKY